MFVPLLLVAKSIKEEAGFGIVPKTLKACSALNSTTRSVLTERHLRTKMTAYSRLQT